MKNDCEISIVIPVYNGENYLSKTLESIRNQTFPSYEVICIDDCSTDSSLSVLRDFEKKDDRIRVFSMPSNLGIVPRVLNFAIPRMRGAYFVYSSQDDLFSEDWLEEMHGRAQETGADAVIPDLVFYYEDEPEKNKELIGVDGNRDICLSNREAVTLSLDWKIPGNALWNSAIIKSIGCFDFAMNADEYSARVYFLQCNKIAFCKGKFFYRQDNPNAITKSISSKSFDCPYTDFRLAQFLRDNSFPAAEQTRIMRRSLDGLLFWKCVLIELGNGMFDDADASLRKTFDSLKSSGIRMALLKSPRLKHLAALIAFMGNYRFFTNFMHFLARFPLVKRRLGNALIGRRKEPTV